MSKQTWEELLLAPVIAATQIANSTSETILIPDTTIPANYFYAGRTLRITIIAALSCVVTTPGTITFRVRWGGVAGTLLVASAALALNIVAQTNDTVELEFWVTCRVEANPGTLIVNGRASLGAARSTAGLVDMIPASAPAAIGSLDLTSQTALSITAQFSVNTNPTNIQAVQYLIESMN